MYQGKGILHLKMKYAFCFLFDGTISFVSPLAPFVLPTCGWKIPCIPCCCMTSGHSSQCSCVDRRKNSCYWKEQIEVLLLLVSALFRLRRDDNRKCWDSGLRVCTGKSFIGIIRSWGRSILLIDLLERFLGTINTSLSVDKFEIKAHFNSVRWLLTLSGI